MTNQEFSPVWVKFLNFYDVPWNDEVAIFYFETYEHLPVKVFEEVLKETKKSRTYPGRVPTVQEIFPAYQMIMDRRAKMLEFRNDPPYPVVIQQSNVQYMALLMALPFQKKAKGEDYVVEKYAPIFARWWTERKHLEIESNCDPTWHADAMARLRDALIPVSPELSSKVLSALGA